MRPPCSGATLVAVPAQPEPGAPKPRYERPNGVADAVVGDAWLLCWRTRASHYLCVAADDESEARARMIAALGWDEVALADVVARRAPRPCEDYPTAQQFT